MEILKVSSRSKPTSVAGAMAAVVRQAGSVEVQVVGAGALNQAVKAVAVARGFVSAYGIDLTCAPTFADIQIDGESRTAVRLLVESRPLVTLIDDPVTAGSEPRPIRRILDEPVLVDHPLAVVGSFEADSAEPMLVGQSARADGQGTVIDVRMPVAAVTDQG